MSKSKFSIFNKILCCIIAVLMCSCALLMYPFKSEVKARAIEFYEDYIFKISNISIPSSYNYNAYNKQMVSSSDSLYLCFSDVKNEIPYLCTLYYPTRYDGIDDTYYYWERSFNLINSSSLNYYKYSINNLKIPVTLDYVNNGDFIYFADINITSIDFNIPKWIFNSPSDNFRDIVSSATRYYRDGSGVLTQEIVYLYSGINNENINDVYVYKAFSIYIKYDAVNTLTSSETNWILSEDIFYLDLTNRGGEPEIIEKETFVLAPIKNVVYSVSELLNIEVLPNFKLGGIFIVLLGLLFMGFVIHIIKK